jgi:hypothetical protein
VFFADTTDGKRKKRSIQPKEKKRKNDTLKEIEEL